MTTEKKQEIMFKVYFEQYGTFILSRQKAAEVLDTSTSSIDRWKDKGIGPSWRKDEGSKNNPVTYLLIDIIIYLFNEDYYQTIS